MKVDLVRFLGECGCGHNHNISVEEIYIEPNASRHLNEILKSYKYPVFICDSNTKKATEEVLSYYFEKNNVIELVGENIHADNFNVEYIKERLTYEADILIAVGSGTIHDLSRYVAFQRKMPFVSMPTAASVDGFVSTVAAMTWNGMKKTFPSKAPIYVLADTNIFSKAPYRLTASGISDLMGKYTALIDWKISNIITGEYFCQRIYDLEMEAVKEVESILKEIKSGDEKSMEKLMYALILSGLAMQMIGNSRPASGAEHHISHLWEMSVINEPVDALHGEKVSVGLILTLERYEGILRSIENGNCKVIDDSEFEIELLKETFGKRGLYEELIKENRENILKAINLKVLEDKLQEIAIELRKLPSSEEIKENLKRAGCITSMEELDLPNIKELTFRLSPYVRRRLTFMRISKLFCEIREYKTEDLDYIIKRHRELYEEEYGFNSTFGEYVEKYLLEFNKEYDENKENIWIAEINSKPVGVIAIAKSDNNTAKLRWFLIEPEMRGKGLGSKLIKVAIDFCREKNYKHIILWTADVLKDARNIYKKYGFNLTESIDNVSWTNNLIKEERWDLHL